MTITGSFINQSIQVNSGMSQHCRLAVVFILHNTFYM